MSYDLGTRFPPPPKYFTLLDPGAYQTEKRAQKQNAAPFLSRAPRHSRPGLRLWTHAIYNQEVRRRIPNCTSMLSKQPRFPYEAFSAEDLKEILCRCGIESPCECPNGKEKDIICQSKVRRRIFKGTGPRSILGDEGLSAPSRKDHGFLVLTDGSQQRIREEQTVENPPFYDARINESTAFYRGCKWSQWTSKRSKKPSEVRPGPTDYFFSKEPTKDEICLEQVRAFKRKTSKQLRYIEIIQRKNELENIPGPATYRPMSPKGTDLKFIGCKAKRFNTTDIEVRPGPADHLIRRDFDLNQPSDIYCHALLPAPPAFGIKARRFENKYEERPGPASYHINYEIANFVHCRTAPFGTSAKRFKEEIIEESDEEEIVEQEFIELQKEKAAKITCRTPTWEFKSKTIRMKPLVLKIDEPSPADFFEISRKVERSIQSQNVAPFCSAEGRFQPWYNWIPVHGKLKTPGPATYCLKRLECPPTFVHGPLHRAKRFPPNNNQNPAPNTYKINNGIETILATHNERLKNNIKNQHKFVWVEPKELSSLSYKEQEAMLLNESISLLDTEEESSTISPSKAQVEAEAGTGADVSKKTSATSKTKMLRTFLYAQPMPIYI